MATVDKNFKVKHGLIVEGNTATVNGNDILTTANTTSDLGEGTNLYFTNQRAIDAVSNTITSEVTAAVDAITTDVIEEGTTNLYFTDQRAIDAVGGSATSANTANTVVKRDGTGAFSAGTISATGVNVQNAGSIFEDSSLVIQSNSGYPIDIYGNQSVTITSGNGDIILNADGTTYLTSVASGNQVATRGYVDGLASNYDAAGAAATAESNANSYTDTAVSSLVNGAPALLDTLNELAAAINNDESFATTIATQIGGKQDSLTAGTGITLSGSTISVTANTYDASGAAATAEQNAKSYADTNFVNVADLPGQLDNYILSTEKGQALGVATLDENAQVPANQLGNVPTAFITGLDTAEGNLSVTSGFLALTQTPSFTDVTVNAVAKQVADTQTVASATTANVLIWSGLEYASAKLIVKASTATNSQISEILLTLDSANNIAMTEFASVQTDQELATVSANLLGGGDVALAVTTLQASTVVTVVGTLLV